MEPKRQYSVMIWGCGRLGEALAYRLISSGLSAQRLMLVRRTRSMLEELQKEYGAYVAQPTALQPLQEFAAEASILYVFHCAPAVSGIDKELQHFFSDARTPFHLIVCSAGVDLETFDTYPETDPSYLLLNLGIIRAHTAICLVPSEHYAKDLALQNLLDIVGIVMPIKPSEFPAATVLSASAVAFFAKLVQDGSVAGVKMGMHYRDALRLLAFSAISAGELLQYESSTQVVDQVSTPGGCTVAGLLQMDKSNLSNGLQESLLAAFKRLE